MTAFPTAPPPHVLSIAGSDPSGGAGIQADLKTFGALDCFGMAALTALTVQNTRGVGEIMLVPPAFVVAQVRALLADIRIDAIKIGMVGSAETAAALGRCLDAHPSIPVVLDPVLAATSGDALAKDDVAEALLAHLAPRAVLLTPNLGEAAVLTGRPQATSLADMEETAKALFARTGRAVLVKGGHLDDATATDVLCTAQGCERIGGRRIATRNTHGTGCTLSSAIAALIARGEALRDAVIGAKRYLEGALAGAERLAVGAGYGPVDHFHGLRRG